MTIFGHNMKKGFYKVDLSRCMYGDRLAHPAILEFDPTIEDFEIIRKTSSYRIKYDLLNKMQPYKFDGITNTFNRDEMLEEYERIFVQESTHNLIYEGTMKTHQFDISESDNSVSGIPHQFINSFGNYLGLKYFLDGVSKGENVYTYVSKNIRHEDFLKIKEKYASCRTIFNKKKTEYEFYSETFGYVVIENDENTPKQYTILCGIGYKELNDLISSFEEYTETEPMASWVTGVDQYGELEIKNFSIKEIHEYNPNFYPCMKNEDIKDFAERYNKSTSSILLLIGPPGTAKTNFIRQLLRATNESVLLTYSDDLKKTDKLFSHFYDSKEKYLIIEDADTYIERREDGNTNMKQLLNITDGLTANPGKKVIFSTNLPSLNRVEPALLRPGRCFEKLEFGKLNDDHLFAAMADIDNKAFENINIPKDGFTIAELFAIKNNEPIDIQDNSTEFGFKKGKSK